MNRLRNSNTTGVFQNCKSSVPWTFIVRKDYDWNPGKLALVIYDIWRREVAHRSSAVFLQACNWIVFRRPYFPNGARHKSQFVRGTELFESGQHRIIRLVGVRVFSQWRNGEAWHFSCWALVLQNPQYRRGNSAFFNLALNIECSLHIRINILTIPAN